MSKKNVKETDTVKRDTVNPWEQAISDAEILIQRARARIRKLKGAIVGFRDMRDAGEPFPGEKGLMGQDSDL